jgi:hypothetical protein
MALRQCAQCALVELREADLEIAADDGAASRKQDGCRPSDDFMKPYADAPRQRRSETQPKYEQPRQPIPGGAEPEERDPSAVHLRLFFSVFRF